LSGRVNSAAQTIAGQVYTGTTRIGGTGGTQSQLATTTGWYNLTTSPITIFQLNQTATPYEPESITTTATATSATVLTLVTTWQDDGTAVQEKLPIFLAAQPQPAPAPRSPARHQQPWSHIDHPAQHICPTLGHTHYCS
jgi:hypothetical protein